MRYILFYTLFILNTIASAQPSLVFADQLKESGYEINTGGYSIVADANGNSYTTGAFHDTVDFDPGPGIFNLITSGYMNGFICKMDPVGHLVWAKKLAGWAFSVSITLDDFNNIYITGHFSGTCDFDPSPAIFNLTAIGGEDLFIAKLDPAGNFIWAKQAGGTMNDWAMGIKADHNGNLYITGETQGTIDCDPGPGIYNLTTMGDWDILVLKLNSTGNFIWAKIMGSPDWDMSFSIALDKNDNVYTTGHFSNTVDFDPGPGIFNITSDGQDDVFISKLDSSGNFVWAKALGGIHEEMAFSVSIDGNGNVYAAGGFQYITDFDPGPGVYNLSSTGGWNTFVCKLNSEGDFVWAKQFLGDGYASSVFADNFGNIYSTGRFDGTVDFDPGPDDHLIIASGIESAFVSQLDTAGNFVCAGNIDGSGSYSFSCSIYSNSNGVFFTGYFMETCDFDPGSGTNYLSAPGGKDIYIARLKKGECSDLITKEDEIFQDVDLTIFPNPSTGIFNVSQLSSQDLKLDVIDVLGNCVFNKLSLKNNDHKIDLTSQPKGIYFLEIISDDEKVVKKIILN